MPSESKGRESQRVPSKVSCSTPIRALFIFPLTHPVEYGCPSLHGDALEDGEHGEDDVVEAGDPLVGTLPVLKAH